MKSGGKQSSLHAALRTHLTHNRTMAPVEMDAAEISATTKMLGEYVVGCFKAHGDDGLSGIGREVTNDGSKGKWFVDLVWTKPVRIRIGPAPAHGVQTDIAVNLRAGPAEEKKEEEEGH